MEDIRTMPLMICPKCGKFHYVPGECPVQKSTAARKDVLRIDRQVSEAHAERSDQARKARREGDGPAGEMPGIVGAGFRAAAGPAGTQAPPVDTLIVGKRRGRPQTISDMKAYKREHERKRRAKMKAPSAQL